jgi:hypothetical protein
MGLDATVYCDCYRSGKLREPPPSGCHVTFQRDGSLDCDSHEMTVLLAFDQWLHRGACEHELGVFLSHRLGNMSLIGLLREELSVDVEKFPLLLTKVVYSGTHCGDFIPFEDLEALRAEVRALASHQCVNPEAPLYVERFRKQMEELIDAALLLRKPIAF